MELLPEKFLDRMKEMLGEEFPLFLDTYQQENWQALRLNTLKLRKTGESAAEYYGVKGGRGFLDEGKEQEKLPLEQVPWAKDGYYFSDERPGKHPFHEAGIYYIQEPSAMAPVGLLGVEPGDRVLDLCAAPGGKSTQIAALLKGQGLLITNEIHPARAKILSENIERMGVTNACVMNENAEHLAEVFPLYFDRILVDAPCSGEGMFRKNEEACLQWSPENVELCAERQQEILDHAARMLCPGGKMVYSTCTFAKQENEEGIERFLERNPEFTLVKQLRMWPHKVKGEGHFAALLQKAGELPEGYKSPSAKGTEKGVLPSDLAEWENFRKENIRCLPENLISGTYLKFGDNLYIAPKELPSLKGLKVLRPGLQLGTIKKNRFEPSHALALALAPQNVLRTCEVYGEGGPVRAYLNGETFSYEGEKGWYLICVDGFSLGWGKLAGGIMKNHYPKGLRKLL